GGRAGVGGGRRLWGRYDREEHLLLREADLASPASSRLFSELLSCPDPTVQSLAGHLALASQGPIDQVPLLSDLVSQDGSKLEVAPPDRAAVERFQPSPGSRPGLASPPQPVQAPPPPPPPPSPPTPPHPAPAPHCLPSPPPPPAPKKRPAAAVVIPELPSPLRASTRLEGVTQAGRDTSLEASAPLVLLPGEVPVLDALPAAAPAAPGPPPRPFPPPAPPPPPPSPAAPP